MAILLFLAACRQPVEPQRFDKKKVEAEVRTMFDHYFADIKNEGLTAEFKYLDSSDQFFWVPPGYLSALTYDSVRVILEGNASAFRSIDYHWDTLQIFPLTNELANYTGIVKGTLTDTGGITNHIALIESGVIIKRPGGWKYLSGQTAALPEKPGPDH